MAASGGPWIRITDGKHWDDKPRWSPDGKTIYFVSGRHGFFNVWGIRFDAVKGKPVGDPFQVTSFENPSLMVPTNIPPVELSLTQEKLVLTIAEVSGSIWILDNVGPEKRTTNRVEVLRTACAGSALFVRDVSRNEPAQLHIPHSTTRHYRQGCSIFPSMRNTPSTV